MQKWEKQEKLELSSSNAEFKTLAKSVAQNRYLFSVVKSKAYLDLELPDSSCSCVYLLCVCMCACM